MDRRNFLRALASLGAAGFTPATVWSGESLRMVYFDNFSPFSWRDEKREMHGIFIDVLTEALFQRLDIPLTHHGFPWARAQEMVRDGAADAFCTVPTPERRNYTEVSGEPVITATFTLFAKRDGPQVEKLKLVKTLEELRPFVIGHYLGSGWAKQKLDGMQIDWAPNVDSVLKKLAVGRGDVHIDVAEMLRPRIKALGLADEIVELPQVLDTQPFNLCIRRGSPFVDVLPKFDKTIRQMREDGALHAIYRKYDALPPGRK